MNTCEAEVDAIRLQLYEETKNLTNEENNKRLEELGKRLSAQYGFQIIQTVGKRTNE
jgi:hypothetical protein